MNVKRPRLTVGLRLLLALCAVASLATGLALLVQDRALSGDLEQAARSRLERAAEAVDLLVERRLDAMAERYRAISETPQFRANLESGDVATLTYYAERLAQAQGAASILFVDAAGSSSAHAGDPELAQALAVQVDGIGREASAFLFVHGGRPYTVGALELRTGRRHVGHLVAAELLRAESVEEWSQLCGASVVFAFAGPRRAGIARTVRTLGPLELRVESSLEPERMALDRSRRRLLLAGCVALALAFSASFPLARGMVRPLLTIQRAAEHIGRGNLRVRVASGRRDELGDVARAFDWMLERLGESIEALQRSQRHLSRAQQLARLGSFGIDPDSGVLVASEQGRAIYGLPTRVGLQLEDLLACIHSEDEPRFRGALEACLGRGTPFQLDHRIVERNGDRRVVHSQGELSTEAGGARLEGTVQDITERKAVEEQVRHLAYHDGLTGLANRRLFHEHLALAIAEARRRDGSVGIVFLDLDRFKRVNDTLGHSVGDELLQAVADRVVRCALGRRRRPRDCSSVVARMGGDEFIVLVPEVKEPRALGRLARSILSELSRPFDLGRLNLVIGCSIGIATWPSDGADAEALLRNCDTAMYHAKERGRNSYQFYSEWMNAASFDRLVFEDRLRRALEGGEFELHYQPKVEVVSGRLTGFEALLRWSDEELGVVPPSEFVTVAEEIGLIDELGRWVLRRAAADMRGWLEAGLPPFHVSVNVSGYQIERGGLVDLVAKVLEETGLEPSCLDLEITESVLLSDEEGAVDVLEDLRRLGVTLSLDDFGTGYSSLSYLRRLPIDSLKIDRCFVQHLSDGSDDAALTAAIISMAKTLGLRVVAEGVEQESQRELLHELGCDELQGYLVSAAVPPEDVPRLVQELVQRRPKRRRGSASRRRRRGSGRSRRPTG
ncbi:MAG: EAL domain-containing protein [Myxococcota bacterium]